VNYFFKCHKCKKKFSLLFTNCGLGYSWSLYKCPKCKQLYAQAYPKEFGGFLPKNIAKDKDVIKIGASK